MFQINGDVIVETREGRRPFRIYEDQSARYRIQYSDQEPDLD